MDANRQDKFSENKTAIAGNELEKYTKFLSQCTCDDERLSVLLLITKKIKSENLSDELCKNLLNSIGFDFLQGLISKSDNSYFPKNIFKSISLNILSSLIHSSIDNPDLCNFVPLLGEIIENRDKYDITIIKDCYYCLNFIAISKSGALAFINYGTINTLVDIYVSDNFGSEAEEDCLNIIRKIANNHVLNIWDKNACSFVRFMNRLCRNFVLNHDSQKFFLCGVISEIIPTTPHIDENNSSDSSINNWKEYLYKGVSDILFSKLNSELRNKALHLSSVILDIFGAQYVLEREKGTQLFLLMVHFSCIEVRMSLEDEDFDTCIVNGANITHYYTIIEIAIKFLVKGGALNLKEKQKLQLYTALKGAMNSVLQFLTVAQSENLMELSSTNSCESSEIVKKSENLNELPESSSKLPEVLSKSENLNELPESSSKLPEVLSKSENLNELPESSSKSPKNSSTEPSNDIESMKRNSSHSYVRAFLFASIRVLGAWLAEETAANKEQVYNILPFIYKIVENNFNLIHSMHEQNKKNIKFKKELENSEDSKNYFSVESLGKNVQNVKMVNASPTINQNEFYLKKNNEAAKNLYNSEKKGILDSNQDGEMSIVATPDLLRFLLPGLCHLTAEDLPRQILINLGLEKFLFDYLNYCWSKEMEFSYEKIKDLISDDTEESNTVKEVYIFTNFDTIITIFNIFMNLAVQEQVRVKNESIYFQLFKFLIKKVSETKIEKFSLHLCGCVCTLGLLIYRHQIFKFSSPKYELNLSKFTQMCIRFLWDCYNVEESPDYSSLVVSFAYKELWNDVEELWYLTMHTLTLLIPQVDLFLNFIIESNWPHSIIITLLLVRENGIDTSVLNSFEELLITLIQSYKCMEFKQRLITEGLKDVVRNHKMEKLSKILEEKTFL